MDGTKMRHAWRRTHRLLARCQVADGDALVKSAAHVAIMHDAPTRVLYKRTNREMQSKCELFRWVDQSIGELYRLLPRGCSGKPARFFRRRKRCGSIRSGRLGGIERFFGNTLPIRNIN